MEQPAQIRLRVTERHQGEWGWVLFRVDKGQGKKPSVRYIDYGVSPSEALAQEAGRQALLFWAEFGFTDIAQDTNHEQGPGALPGDG